MPQSNLASKSKLSIARRQRVEAARPVSSWLFVYMLRSEESAATAVKFCRIVALPKGGQVYCHSAKGSIQGSGNQCGRFAQFISRFR
jgi:hypothetical protein